MIHQVFSPALSLGNPVQGKPPTQLRSILKKVNLTLGVLLLLELLFHLFISPQLLVRKVEVTGYPGNPDEVLAMAGLEEGVSFFGVDENNVASLILANPTIRTVEVRKVFPEALRIEVEMRQPVALLVRPDTSETYVVDAEGVIFPKNLSRGMDYPLVAGFGWNSEDGLPVLPELYTDFLRDMNRLRAEFASIYELLSEVRVNSHSQTGFSLELSFVHTPVKIITGSRLEPKVLKQGILFLDLMGNRAFSGGVRELDMREGTAVFRERGARSDG